MKSRTPPASRNSLNWFLIVLIVVFLLTMTIFIVQFSENDSNASILKVIWNAPTANEHPEFHLVNVREKSDAMPVQKNSNSDESQRQVRDADASGRTNRTSSSKTPYYYEEQRPVVVHSETIVPTVTSYRQPPAGPPYYATPAGQQDYYRSSAAVTANDYDNGPSYDDYETRPAEDYTDTKGRASSGGGVAPNENRPYDAFYRGQQEWSRPVQATGGNRKLATANNGNYAGNRDPYDYDYPAIFSPQYRRPMSTARPKRPEASTEVAPQSNPAESFLSILNTLKTMWRIYQSFTMAWNTIAEHRQKQEDLMKDQMAKQKPPTRLNSKRPTKLNKLRKSNDTSIEEQQQQGDGTDTTATTTTTKRPPKTTKATGSATTLVSGMDEPRRANKDKAAKRKGETQAADEVDGQRTKRQSTGADADNTAVSEGRYIKGDPLKGYYDFVITEGSYKFWAAFQVGTALLIIYSTFAAIYYSKVNPLVSDYDYTDYLGGARSLSDSGGELDFVDDSDDGDGSSAANKQASIASRWAGSWMPRVGHSLKFILDAIDKLPLSEDENTSATLSVEKGAVADVDDDDAYKV